MAISDAALWHQVHAEREDGVAAMFLVRDVEPRLDQPQMFVIEMPYPITDLSKLPDAASYRRLDTFQEQWVEPACEVLGWTFVASKSEDGSFFLYLYGSGDPNMLLEKLAPFDGALGFFSEVDPDWSEYAALRALVEQAEAADEHVHTDSCNHDHTHDLETMSDGISVIDLTGEPSERMASMRAETVELGNPHATRSPRAKAESRTAASRTKPKPASKPAKRAARAKPAARKAAPKAKKPAAKKPAAKKPAAKKPAAKKPAAKKQVASKRPKPRTAYR